MAHLPRLSSFFRALRRSRLRPVLAGLLAAAMAAAGPPDLPVDLGQGHTLVPRSSYTDPAGQTHTRLEHRYLGLRVWGSELILHGEGPAPAAERLAQARMGKPGVAVTASDSLPMAGPATPLAEPLGLDLTPSMSLEQARQAILPDFPGTAALQFPSVEQVIYPRMLDLPDGTGGMPLNAVQLHRLVAGYQLAYLIRVEAGDGVEDGWDYLVDAHSAKVLQRLPVAQADSPAVGEGNGYYNGIVELDTTSTATGYSLVDPTRGQGGFFPSNPDFGGNAVTDMQHGQGPPVSGRLVTSGNNAWGDGAVDTGSLAVDAAYGLQATWDYFGTIHGWNGIDNTGKQTFVRINYLGLDGNHDNAFWDPSTFNITVLDGSVYEPLVNLPILAHEFTHGVTGATANLIYAGESGGLNEATSDIFGVMVDTLAREGSPTRNPQTIPNYGTNWFIPVTLASPAGTSSVLRYLYKPSLDGVSYDAWSPSLAKVNVHFSSGPMNRAFYFLSQGASSDPRSNYYSSYLPGGMTGIGNDEAARIWFRALTVYLVPTSNYKAARTAALRAAIYLYDTPSAPPSAEHLAVRQAFAAINVGSATSDDLVPPQVTAQATALPASPSGTSYQLGATLTPGTGLISEVDYLVDDILVAVTLPPAFSATLDTAHLLANGTRQLTAAAFSSGGNEGLSLSVPLYLNNQVQQLLADPGLEGGGAPEQLAGGLAGPGAPGWQGDTDGVVRTDFTGAIPHSGYRYASFDRGAGLQSSTLSQQVALPAAGSGGSALLGVWSRIQGNPALGPVDTLLVQVQPAGAASPTVLDTLTNQQARADWIRHVYDLSAYLGQTVTVSFVSNINPGTGTAFLLDDMTLAWSGAPQVQVAFAPPGVAPNLFAGGTVGPLAATVTGSGNSNLSWSILEGATGGTLDGSLVYHAPAQPGFYHVVATSQADPTVSAQLSIQVLPPVSVVPASAQVGTGGALPLTVLAPPGAALAFSLQEGPGAGTVVQTAPGLLTYTAPAAPGTYHLLVATGSAPASPFTVTLTVTPAIQVALAPAALTLATGSNVVLNASIANAANPALVWSILEDPGGGSIAFGPDNAVPIYTAPPAAGTFHVIVTSVEDPTRSATATLTVVANAVAVNPPSAVLLTGATQVFQAFAPGGAAVAWSLQAGAGALDPAGIYTAPGSAGSATLVASAGGYTTPVPVAVTSTDFTGDGQVVMNAADLAILADAWGSSTAPGAPFNQADLDQDGTVDDQDVALFFSRFGGLP